MEQIYEAAELDFRGVENNQQVRDQGVLVCIKTHRKGWFSPALERYVTRQDLAKKRPLQPVVINNDGNDFGKKMKASRKHLRVTLRELKEKTGIDIGLLYDVENERVFASEALQRRIMQGLR